MDSFFDLDCTKCGRGPMRDGTTVYKNGAEYRCEQHLDPEHRNEKTMEMAAVVERMGNARDN